MGLQRYLGTVGRNLVQDEGFAPAGDELGLALARRAAGVFYRQVWSYDIYLCLIPVHLENEIEGLLAELYAEIQAHPVVFRNSSVVVIPVLIFPTGIDPAAREHILSSKRAPILGRRHLTPWVVDLATRELWTYRGLPRIPEAGAPSLLDFSALDEPGETAGDTEGEAGGAGGWPDLEAPLSSPAATPLVTYALIIFMAVVWVFLELSGGSTDPANLERFGARVNELIWAGQWWRLVTYQFLHIGFLHAGLNLYSLYWLGTLSERAYGHLRFIVIYFLAGLAGGAAGLFLNPGPQISAGASGSIFGLFGALGYYALNLPPILRRHFWSLIGTPLVINLVYGFFNPGIDNYAHVGGLIGGALASAVAGLPHRPSWRRSVLAAAVLAALVLGSYGTGLYLRETDPRYELTLARRSLEAGDLRAAREAVERGLIKGLSRGREKEASLRESFMGLFLAMGKRDYDARDWPQAIEIFKEASEINPGHQLPRQMLSSAWTNQGVDHFRQKDFPRAEQAFLRAVEYDPSNASASYNLALAYLRQDKRVPAIQALEAALKADPGMREARELLDRLRKLSDRA